MHVLIINSPLTAAKMIVSMAENRACRIFMRTPPRLMDIFEQKIGQLQDELDHTVISVQRPRSNNFAQHIGGHFRDVVNSNVETSSRQGVHIVKMRTEMIIQMVITVLTNGKKFKRPSSGPKIFQKALPNY